ncbi:MAG: nicotinate (nicotinamide) nucleotide adenylyltransferase [Paludibacter sp.]|nr:nicotinate (nicotinamide) nucleotide adenylyltransferase [Paludibacter sp.]
MKIALYPGSFNPVHNGHIQLARSVVEQHLADEVWLVISPHNPLKESALLQDEVHREAMICLALEGEKGLFASTVEFTMPRPSYTIDTIRELQRMNPGDQYVLMIGSDNALIFNQWKEYQELLSIVEVYVYPRRGFSVSEALALYPKMRALNTPYYDISSTQLREWIRQGVDTSDWLHPDVQEYISVNHLYL